MPSSQPVSRTVEDVVSLRDLPATIVNLVGLGVGSPFPGRSLARIWDGSIPIGPEEIAAAELSAPNPWSMGVQAPSPAEQGPMISLTNSHYAYIKSHERTELFDSVTDPEEQTDLAAKTSMRSVLERFKAEAERIQQPRGSKKGSPRR